MNLNESILISVKKLLGIGPDYTAFDTDLIIHINSVLFILNQLGVGPDDGYSITDASNLWSEFLPDEDNYEIVKTYVALRVRLLFDPPTGTLYDSIKGTCNEIEWRIGVKRDESL